MDLNLQLKGGRIKMLYAILLLLSLQQQAHALTMDVAAGAVQCVYFDVKPQLSTSTKIFGSFQVASGGFLDIDLVVKTQGGDITYTAERKTQDRFQIGPTQVHANTGEWSACFSNKMSTLTSKAVSFSFRVGEGYGDDALLNGKDVATKKEVVPIEQNILKLASELVDIREIQNYANVRERAHRDSEYFLCFCIDTQLAAA
jgi:p24 family protein beta-1